MQNVTIKIPSYIVNIAVIINVRFSCLSNYKKLQHDTVRIVWQPNQHGYAWPPVGRQNYQFNRKYEFSRYCGLKPRYCGTIYLFRILCQSPLISVKISDAATGFVTTRKKGYFTRFSLVPCTSFLYYCKKSSRFGFDRKIRKTLDSVANVWPLTDFSLCTEKNCFCYNEGEYDNDVHYQYSFTVYCIATGQKARTWFFFSLRLKHQRCEI